jgi:hypothetical protein
MHRVHCMGAELKACTHCSARLHAACCVPGTPNFRLMPPSHGDLSNSRSRSHFGDASMSGVHMDSDGLEPPRQSFLSSSEWPQHYTFVPGPSVGFTHSRQTSADYSRPSIADPELALILSPTVSLAGPLSRQMSMASYRSSVALTTLESTIFDASKVSVSRMSLVSHERLPLVPADTPDDLPLEAAALRASLAADKSQQSGTFVAAAESPKRAAGKAGRQGGPAEPGLVEMAEALAGATGAVFLVLIDAYYCL